MRKIMRKITVLWAEVWKRDEAKCAFCLEGQTVGNTHTVKSLWMEQPIDWTTLEKEDLVVTCNDCFVRFRRLFLRRLDVEARKARRTEAQDGGGDPASPRGIRGS